MIIYFLLIFIILLVPFIPLKKNKNNIVLIISMWCLFLVMALKAPTVGRDIEGYKQIYDAMQFYSWSNYDTSWMEWGYEFLMMVFTHIFHASFQTFMICVYAFVYYSYFRFFKRYSEDYTTSVLLYICFTFFTFDTSAVRNMLGVAICLYALPFAEKKGLINLLIYSLITLAAAQIHKSAYIFFAVYLIIKIPFSLKSSILYVGTPVALLLFKSQLYKFINVYFKSVEEAEISFGGNLLLYSVCLLLTIFIWFMYDRQLNRTKNEITPSLPDSTLASYFSTSGLAMRMIYVGIILQVFGSGTVLIRMAQYMQFFILVLIPNNINRFAWNIRLIFKIILYVLAILYFLKYSLIDNSLDIVPYKFFWE